MCQAIPRPVLRVVGERVEVAIDGRPEWVTAGGLVDLQPGEYVVVYAGAALERLPTTEAEELLRFYAELEGLLAASVEAEAMGQPRPPLPGPGSAGVASRPTPRPPVNSGLDRIEVGEAGE